MGERGTLLWDGGAALELAVVTADTGFTRKDTRTTVDAGPIGREGHLGCLDEMYAALAEGRASQTDCRDNAKTMAMVFAALESSRLGGTRVPV